MKFSGYFFLAVAAVFVVFAQQSDAGVVEAIKAGLDAIKDELNIGNKRARDTIRTIENSSKENEEAKVFVDATIRLKNAFITGTKILSKAQGILMDGIKKAQKIVLENPEAAKQILLQAFENSQNELFKSGIPVLKELGKALGLSNEGARAGLEVACQLIQKSGFSTLDAMNNAMTLATQGWAAGGNATQVLLATVKLSVKSGFAGSYSNIQLSIRVALQALRDAQSRPMQGQVESPNCEAAANDPEGSDALNDINEAANNALQRGANRELVQKFEKASICSLREFEAITDEVQGTIEDINKIVGTQPAAVKSIYRHQVDSFREKMHGVASKIYVDLGSLVIQSGNQSNNATDEAIEVLEECKVEVFLGIETAENVLDSGMLYSPDARKIAVEAATNSVIYGKIAFLQGLVKAVRLIFSQL